MTRLRKIWIHLEPRFDADYTKMYNFSEAMIKAIQLHHGPNQLVECRMIPNPLVKGPEIDDDGNWSTEINLSGARRVLSLLPSPRHYLTLPRPDGSTVSLDHPFDPRAATIQNLKIAGGLDRTWRAMMRLHPGHSQSQILQRFRGMTSLSIYPKAANGNDENLLDWAACEAEHYNRKPGGCQLIPLIPLEKLKIRYKYENWAPQSSSETPKWKILQDGLLGFSRTLSELEVAYPEFDSGMNCPQFTIPRLSPKLRSLYLHELTTDRSVWEQAPNIEKLSIILNFPPFRDYSGTPDIPQNDQNTGATPLSPISVDATTIGTIMQPPHRQLPEIWFHCPMLTQLVLENRAINILDPKCLHFSPNLQKLELRSMSVMFRKASGSHESPEALRVLYPTRWTWDWSFPVLHTLILRGDLHQFRFNMGILRSYPTLESIVLEHFDADHPFPLRIKGILDTSLDGTNNQMLPFTHSNLAKVSFSDYCSIELDELACLLQLLPGLTQLVLRIHHFDEGFGDRELIKITKSHPALVSVITSMQLTTDPLSASGLSDERELKGKMDSVPITEAGDDESETSKEGIGIFYSFKYDEYDSIDVHLH
ncbi:hypothetical protein BGW42_005285 [Actinomortierella wolfii]|nr:hypothetical protein BGW42_005285 [Actinomortierella wolfii]